jgi:hypothetical protein
MVLIIMAYRGACGHWWRYAAEPDPAGARDDHYVTSAVSLCTVAML